MVGLVVYAFVAVVVFVLFWGLFSAGCLAGFLLDSVWICFGLSSCCGFVYGMVCIGVVVCLLLIWVWCCGYILDSGFAYLVLMLLVVLLCWVYGWLLIWWFGTLVVGCFDWMFVFRNVLVLVW